MSLEGRRRKEWDAHAAQTVEKAYDMGVMANYPRTLILPFERLIYTGSMLFGAYMILASSSSPLLSTVIQQAVQGPGGIVLQPGATLPNGVSIPGIWSVLPATVLSPGALLAFCLLASRLSMPLVTLAHLQEELSEVGGAVGQIATVLNAPPEVTRPNGLRLPIRGQVEFKDVRFRYSPEAPYALDRVTFTVPQGTMLGIMGRSGSGKTTVTRLLQCLHSSFEGTIKIDNMDLREIDLAHLRTHIGVVPQENFLFSGSIRDNISMARPDATFLDVVRAAQLAGAEEFIEKLPRGYDTVLEEGAVNLSGGQRQRLAIARALLVDPPVLILDEATSALDAESEMIVNANLRRMAKGRTVLSISHRLSMLVEADAILVLEQGRVYDIGTHEELLERCDIYKHMWYQQNRHLDPHASSGRLVISAEEIQ
jgi:ATP-binding cassette subfamily B protein